MKKEITVNNITFIQKGTRIEGHIESAGKVHISGSLTGNINAKEHSVIHIGGIVRGNIISQRAEISGELQGDIRVTDLLHLKSTAQILGNIYAKYLTTEEGAQVNGYIYSGKEIDVLNHLNPKEDQLSIPQRKAG